MLGDVINSDRLTIRDETDDSVGAALLRDSRTNDDAIVFAKMTLRAMSRNK